jgi:hypothetical protein
MIRGRLDSSQACMHKVDLNLFVNLFVVLLLLYFFAML